MPSNIKIWAGNSDFLTWSRHKAEAFSEARTQLLIELSNQLLTRDYSGPLKALGFWLRESQLRHWQQSYTQDKKLILAPIGRVFIVSPSNVEGLFAYSWSLSFLLGNETVVRVSEHITDDQRALFELLNELGQSHTVLNHQAFISYDKRSEWTQRLSNWCQFRMLWGSDQSITDIRRLVLPAQTQEWVFPDRYSVSVLHLKQDDIPHIPNLAEGFARDVSTHKQQACASPKWVFWYQTDKVLQQQFWQAVDACLEGDFPATERLVSSQYLCALGGAEYHHGNFQVVEASSILGRDQNLLGVVGQTCLDDLNKCSGLFPENIQSVTCHGLSREHKALIASCCQVRQFSPLGQALSFEVNWDGQDLIEMLARDVRL